MNENMKHAAENLLIELGTEELPPKALKKLGQCFANEIVSGLKQSGMLAAEEPEVKWFATPRRLAVWIEDVLSDQPDRTEQKRGPAIQAAFDQEGQPTRAAMGFAGSCGTTVDQLERLTTDKGEWLSYQVKIEGEKIDSVVNQCLLESVKKLPIPKRMRWGASDVEFVRPVHWLICLHGQTVLNSSILGLVAGDTSRGHRFHAPDEVIISSADDYATILKDKAHIIADFAERQALIVQQAKALIKPDQGQVVIDEELLDIVTGLVEWPHAILGEFDPDFLKIPAEVLVSSMRDHQKYFHIEDTNGDLCAQFVTISNIESTSDSRVRDGNQRVLRARLSDAQFFWDSDQKIKLFDRLDSLKDVMFHKKLGSLHDKAQRLASLSASIAELLGADSDHATRAALLAKCDLVTDMVGEFPELQGAIGQYYAIHDQEESVISDAIEQHYSPRFAGDTLPTHVVSQCLALADRLDSLVGIFSCGEIPTGDKDPYALRRAALGILRILIEQNINLDLLQLLNMTVNIYQSSDLKTQDGMADDVFLFVNERLRAYYLPQGFSAEEIAAVMACRPTSPLDFDHRLRAVHSLLKRNAEVAQSLAAANKRIANILNKSEFESTNEWDKTTLVEEAEQNLVQSLGQVHGDVISAFKSNDYESALTTLSTLKDPIDLFFDQVMVMADDPEVRQSRLELLSQIRELFLCGADISLLKVDK